MKPSRSVTATTAPATCSALRDRIGVTPACGLAGATPEWARTAIGLARRAAELFAEDPEAIE
ncbi:hypothetical protein MAHJHV54_47930 [Mycobacterium avium subsp. hominissuis]